MRKSRAIVLLSIAVVAAVLLAPATASALLTNDYGLEYAGQEACVACHGTAYAETSHGEFAVPYADPGADYMWPAGRIGVGDWILEDEIGITVGAGTGLREYMVFAEAIGEFTPGVDSPFLMVEGLEWDPIMPDTWEIGATGIELGAYTCGNCHHLGYARSGYAPVAGNGSGTPTRNTMARDLSKPETDLATWAEGMSVQCENCHGTGISATVDEGGHWNVGVGIVGFNTAATNRNAKAMSTRILDSDVCGQCHGRYKSGNNYWGYTPDTTLTDYIEDYLYTFADVPSEEDFLSSPGSYMFYPNGANKGLKHSYYSEWQLSGHSWRGGVYGEAVEATSSHDGQVAILEADPRASEYMETGVGHFNAKTSGSACLSCHTGEGFLKRKDADIMSGFTVTSDNSGYAAQECAVCHIAHGADTEEGEAIGMKVRDPEDGNNSLCEDCHNWQKEIDGTATIDADNRIVGPLPNASIDGGRPFSHPTREVYNGKGMYGVEQAGMFMPGVKCEECHMPATRSDFPSLTDLSRYEDRSWKRYSHRMFIMEPGDAEAWGLAPWGDSCSPCHAGQTQAELQEYLEEWLGMTADADAELVAAYAPAYTLANANGLDDAEKALLGRAYYNHKFYTSDGSMGAHNPYYVAEGLEAGTKMALSVGGAFEAIFSPSAPVANGSLTFVAGKLVNGDDSGAYEGMVDLEMWNGSAWVNAGSTMSDMEGNFAFTLAPTATASYRVRWNRCEDNVADLVSSSVSITVAVPPSTTTFVPVAGTDRFTTAVEASKLAFADDSVTTVVIATGLNWPDALGGSALAGAVDGPILLVSTDSIPAAVLTEIDRVGASEAIILGGESAVGPAVETALETLLGASNVERIAGDNRYETAQLIADRTILELGGGYDGTAFFATGVNFPDALAAAPLASANGWPIYLVAPGTTTVTANAAVTDALVLGSTTAVSSSYYSALETEFGAANVDRLSGADRYKTAVAIATYGVNSAGLGWDMVGIATGENFPDALAGGVLQGKDGSVMLLTPSASLNADAAAALSAHKGDISEVRYFGSTSALSTSVRNAVAALLD